MPVLKQGFLFRYADKIICGVVALGLLASVAWAYLATRSLPPTVSVEQLDDEIRGIQSSMTTQPPATEQLPWQETFNQVFYQMESPPAVRRGVFFWPLPVIHKELKVGTQKEFVLDFGAPLAKGSVNIQPLLLQLLEHPVGGDYSRVKLLSADKAGSVSVTGMQGDVKHEYPVVVDAEAGKTAYPPVDLAVTGRQGLGRITFRTNPRNAAEGVTVTAYRVMRRDWGDPFGSYASVGEVTVGVATGSSASQSSLVSPATDTISVEDRNIVPGRHYSYKICTVGSNTFPAAGEFAAPVEVAVLPNIDFMMTGRTGDQIRFEVRKVNDTTKAVEKATFMVALGDEIGGVVTDALSGRQTSFSTGCILVDYQQSVVDLARSRIPSDRIVYADPQGDLQVRWRGEAESELWNEAASGAGVRSARGPLRY